MHRSELLIDMAAGIVGGLIATRVTDHAQKALWQMTPESEKAREPDTGRSSAEAAAEKLLDGVNVKPTEDKVEATRFVVHYGLGMMWGPLYPIMRRAGASPLVAGTLSGTSLSLLVDEALCPALEITPPNSAYPASSHLRGLVTHIIWGLALAATAEGIKAAVNRRSAPLAPALADRPGIK